MTQPSGTDLQAWPLAMAAFRRVWEMRDDLLRLSAVPVIVNFLLNIWLQGAVGNLLIAIEPGQTPDPDAISALEMPLIGYALASWCVVVVFVVNWMRFLVLGPDAVPGVGLAFGRRHFRMLLLSLVMQIGGGFLLAIMLAIVLLVYPAPALLFAAVILFMIWYLIAVVRLGPVWVGIAIDAPMKLRDAWRRTEGYGIRLAVAFVTVSFLLFVLQTMLLSLSVSLGFMAAAPLALSFISVVIQYVMFASIGAVFVLAYPRFVSETV